MISDINERAGGDRVEADVCIVGAGPAGLLVALALAARGVRCVLLESGGATVEPVAQDLNRVIDLGKPNPGVSDARFRAFGGTSTRWGGQVLPLFAIDMGARPWLDLPAWPIARDELDPHYEASLDFLGIGDVIRDARAAWRRRGMDEPDYGEALRPYFSWWCRKPDMGQAHRATIAASDAIDCILNATVTAIDLAEGRIAGVVARSLDGAELRVAARDYVFATGGVDTPRLLLQPLADGSEPPWAKSGILGAYFQDHPGMVGGSIRPTRGSTLHSRVVNLWIDRIRYQPRIRLADRVQREQATLNVGGVIIPRPADPELLQAVRAAGAALLGGRIDREALGRVAAKPLRAVSLAARQGWDLLVNRRGFNPADGGYDLGIQLEQRPRRDSRITLSDERDGFGQRRAALDWKVDPAEVRAARIYAEAVKASLEAAGLAEVEIDADLRREDSAVIERMHGQAHHVGTARMGRTIDEGVVDSDLRIFGADNGYVASGAVFPTSSFSNPTHTILALAHRLAGHLARRHGK